MCCTDWLAPASAVNSSSWGFGSSQRSRSLRSLTGWETTPATTCRCPEPAARRPRTPCRSRSPTRPNGTSPIALHARSGKLTDSGNANAVDQAASALSKDPDVAAVVKALTQQGASQLSKDQTTGYLSVTLKVSPGSLSESQAQEIINRAADPAKAAGLGSRRAVRSGRRSRSHRPNRASSSESSPR